MKATTPLRVLLAKPGLDGHDRGVLVVASALRDAGFEVIYTGLRQTPAMIASAAEEEDVDVVGLSVLSGAHRTLVPRVLQELKDRSLGHVRVIVGGIIPHDDRRELEEGGVAGVFGPGANTKEIVSFFSGLPGKSEAEEDGQ